MAYLRELQVDLRVGIRQGYCLLVPAVLTQKRRISRNEPQFCRLSQDVKTPIRWAEKIPAMVRLKFVCLGGWSGLLSAFLPGAEMTR